MKMLNYLLYENTRYLFQIAMRSIHVSSLKSFENYLMQLKNTHSLYTLARTCIQRSSLKSQIDSIKNGD